MRNHRPRPHRAGSFSPPNSPASQYDRTAPSGQGPAGSRDRHNKPQNQPPRGEVIFGVEPVRELLAAAPSAIRTLYVKAGTPGRFADEIQATRAAGGQIINATDDALARMAGSEGRHQGIVAVIREYTYAPLEQLLEEKPDPLIVVDGVTDPRNMGAILRSAECAGVRAVVLARDRTAAITPAAVKASAGAWAHLKIARCGNVAQTLEALKAVGYWTAALAPDGDVSIYDLDATRRLALVVGAEGAGVRELVKKTADFIVNIPMYGQVGSLNVSVAAALALFELARRRGAVPVSQEAYPGRESS
jgi:23S rRNA (guanosine2251-2'-O)-methyltransferase